MKNTVLILLICLVAMSCNTAKRANVADNIASNIEQDTVRIANDKLEYEIIIIEPGFNAWLLSTAKPEGYYSQQFFETKNHILVSEWNSRVLQPLKYNPSLYEMRIDYQPNIDYGYEVNYKLYNYFIYFQLHYKQQLSGLTPRI